MKRGHKTRASDLPPDESENEFVFRHPFELVATIASRFVDGSADDTAAAERAIAFLDAIKATIDRKTKILRARERAKRIAAETPYMLSFVKGINGITGKRTETEATKAFRDYLRLNVRLSALGHPSQLSTEQVRELMEPLTDDNAKTAEDARIEGLLASYREEGFSQRQLVTLKEYRQHLQTRLVQPYRNSEKGKKGGRPRAKRKD